MIDDLPLHIFSELATRPIFENSGWIKMSDHRGGKNIVTTDLFCCTCRKEKTFSGKAYSRVDLMVQYQKENTPQYFGFGMPPFYPDGNDQETTVGEMIPEIVLPVDDVIIIQLSCPTCCGKVYIPFHVDIESHIIDLETDPRMSIDSIRVTKIGEYPNQESNRLQKISMYITDFNDEYNYLEKAERSFYANLGAGAVIYLRKAYEILLYKILDEKNIARPHQFKQTLQKVDDVAGIVPDPLKERAYGLFGEMSDIVHGETNDAVGLDKYEALRDVFKMILDNVLFKRKQAMLAKEIKLDSDSKRGGATK